MKQTIYILLLFVLPVACKFNEKNKEIDSPPDTISNQVQVIESRNVDKQITNPIDCDFIWDTIESPRYRMHKYILDKFENKEKRGYLFDQNGDTLNNFLYDKDIFAFVTSLDTNETGVYFLLTNKVVNLIISEDAVMLAYGLPPNHRPTFNYFLKHAGDLKCGDFNFKKVIDEIEQKMDTPNEKAVQNKQVLLQKLAEEKYKHADIKAKQFN